MFDFSVIVDNIKDLYREKKVLFIVISILIVLFFLGLIAVVVQSSSHEPEVPVYKEEVLYPDQKLLLPESEMSFSKDLYGYSLPEELN